MKLTVTIEMDNAAFEDGNGGMTEAAYILERLATRLENEGDSFSGALLKDENGNTVGSAGVSN